jgi:DNA-binding HxlR family transcriptional regulator
MQRTNFGEMACSFARTVDVVGEPWTPLIMRDLYVGINRFELLREDLGVPRQTLVNRLDLLVERGVAERARYQSRPDRFEYLLTQQGKELLVAILPLMAWGDRWLAGAAGPPARLTHVNCGAEIDVAVTCDHCGEVLNADQLSVAAGPGANPGRGTQLMGSAIGDRVRAAG